jgi:hypothetical protein
MTAESGSSGPALTRRKNRRVRARPAFEPTDEQQRIVREMKSIGDTDETIARALAIDLATLGKYFQPELDTGLAVQRREIVGMLYASARAGNVSAIKRLEQLSRVANAETQLLEDDEPLELGKKEAAQLAARTAGQGSDWGDDLDPAARAN